MENQSEEKSQRCSFSFWSCFLFAKVTIHPSLDFQNPKPEIFAERNDGSHTHLFIYYCFYATNGIRKLSDKW